jgi:hypothetical protein
MFTDAEVDAACGPIAMAGVLRFLDRATPPETLLREAGKFGWTAEGGMNGAANFEKMLRAFGVSCEPEDDATTDDVTEWLERGPVVISTREHYYLAQRRSLIDDDLYVGNTGLARRDGDVWMSLSRIRTLDRPPFTFFHDFLPDVKPAPPPPTTEPDPKVTTALDTLWNATLTLAGEGKIDYARRLQESIVALKVALRLEAPASP